MHLREMGNELVQMTASACGKQAKMTALQPAASAKENDGSKSASDTTAAARSALIAKLSKEMDKRESIVTRELLEAILELAEMKGKAEHLQACACCS